MPRGGARRGAGRPTKLNDLDRLVIGQAVETRIRESLGREVAKRVEAATREQQLIWARARAVPISERPNFAKSIHSGRGDPYLEDLEIARREDQGVDADDEQTPSQHLHVQAALPRGEVKRIVKEVADEWAISTDMVRRCRATYLSVVADL